MGATVTVTKAKAKTDPILFAAHLSAARLKDMVASAKPISKTLVLELDSGNEGRHLRYWAIDDGRVTAMVGVARDNMFQAIGGDDTPHVIEVPTALLHQAISVFDSKRTLDLKLRLEDNRFALILVQAKQDGEEPDIRTISVVASNSTPTAPVVPKVAYAAIDLTRLNKVLGGLKQNTDVVMVSIGNAEFEVSANTKRLQDGWKHPTTTVGKASGIFAVGALKNVVSGAVQADSFGEIFLTDEEPLRVQAVSEDLTVQFWVARREAMK